VSPKQDAAVFAPDEHFDAFAVQLVRDRAVSDDWGTGEDCFCCFAHSDLPFEQL
jgi:hypothetical protein